MRSRIESLASLSPDKRRRFLASLSAAQRLALLHDWRFSARPSQLPPSGEYDLWLVCAGRGFGKTRTGSEWCHTMATPGTVGHLVGRTASDVRKVMLDGPAGVKATAKPWNPCEYKPSQNVILWANGARAYTFSSEKPDQLRGPQCHWLWGDEPQSWRYEEAFSNANLGCRLGLRPKRLYTFTPRPTRLTRELLAEAETSQYGFITRGATAENRANLSEQAIARWEAAFGGTRLGRQELLGEMLTDDPRALFKRDWFDRGRSQGADAYDRVVVGVDPGASSGEDAAETGIVVAGVVYGTEPQYYVLDDLSVRATPERWAKAAVDAYRRHRADCIVAESNNGGEMVRSVIEQAGGRAVPVRLVWASRGKATRAEPISLLYERGTVSHCGVMPVLEDQMAEWVPGSGQASPDRMDALVWALTALIGRGDVQTDDGLYVAW